MANEEARNCNVVSDQTNIQQNVNQFISDKIWLYQRVMQTYLAQPTRSVLGECHEMTIQAGLVTMSSLKASKEYFLVITASNTQNDSTHSYGLVVSESVLMGKGLSDAKQRQRFIEKFSRPFFKEAKTGFFMGTDTREIRANNVLFWKALGVFGGKIINQEAATQVHLCDPYAEKYCDGLGECLDQSKPAVLSTYLEGPDIKYIQILTQDIPERARLQAGPSMECFNQNVNQKIHSLIEKQIIPAKEEAEKRDL